jgi:hypothetical protein
MESRADLCSGFGLSFLVQTDNTRKFGHQSQLEAPIMHSIDFVSSKILAAEDIWYTPASTLYRIPLKYTGSSVKRVL